MTSKRKSIAPKGLSISVFTDNNDYNDLISLTDIAKYKNQDSPKDIIKNWMRSRNTLEFLGVWEQMNNPDFINTNYTRLINESGSNAFVMSPAKWVSETNAKGIVSKTGRNGGTFGRTDIAFEFASWISPEFKLFIIQDYQNLKRQQNDPEKLEWDAKRLLAKINNRIQTDAVKEYLVPKAITRSEASFTYAKESDRLYMALFGTTNRKWKKAHPNAKGNMRDYATMGQLLILSNLESINAELISQGLDDTQRTLRLNEIALRQAEAIQSDTSKKQLARLQNKDLDPKK